VHVLDCLIACACSDHACSCMVFLAVLSGCLRCLYACVCAPSSGPLDFLFLCHSVSFSVHSNVHRGEHKFFGCVCVCVCVCVVCVCVWIREMRNEQCLLKMLAFGGGGAATSTPRPTIARARERERAGVYKHIYVHTVCEDAGTKGVCVCVCVYMQGKAQGTARSRRARQQTGVRIPVILPPLFKPLAGRRDERKLRPSHISLGNRKGTQRTTRP
jgi:hypothetical protein